jgi:hypothetical protein
MDDMNLALALPLIEAIAEWEEENGTLAAIMPSEYAGFVRKLSKAAIKGSARGALSDEVVDRRYPRLDSVAVGDRVKLLPDDLQPQDSMELRCNPNSTLDLGDDPLIVSAIAIVEDDIMIEVESSFKRLHLGRFYNPVLAVTPDMVVNKYIDDSHLYEISYQLVDDDCTEYASVWGFTQEDAQRRFRAERPHAIAVQAWQR